GVTGAPLTRSADNASPSRAAAPLGPGAPMLVSSGMRTTYQFAPSAALNSPVTSRIAPPRCTRAIRTPLLTGAPFVVVIWPYTVASGSGISARRVGSVTAARQKLNSRFLRLVFMVFMAVLLLE